MVPLSFGFDLLHYLSKQRYRGACGVDAPRGWRNGNRTRERAPSRCPAIVGTRAKELARSRGKGRRARIGRQSKEVVTGWKHCRTNQALRVKSRARTKGTAWDCT